MRLNKRYEVNQEVTREELYQAGFSQYEYDHFLMRKHLYRHDNSQQPYVTLEVRITLSGDMVYMTESVVSDDGIIYPPFYDLYAHDNLVLDKIHERYYSALDFLEKRNILKLVEE